MPRVAKGFPDIAGEHRRWIAVTGAVMVFAILLFEVLAHFVDGVDVRRVQYIYGLLAGLTMMFVMGYGIRHRLPEVNLGHLRWWMQSHVYLSAVTFVFFAIHTGFRAGGALSFLLAVCFYVTMVSGVLGWFIFQSAPKMITAVEHYENLFADFPHIHRRLMERGDSIVDHAAPELRNFYQKVIRPTLQMRTPLPRHYLRVGTHDKHVEDMMFDHMDRLLSPEDQKRLEELRRLLNQKDETLFQIAAQKVLRGWVIVHVPFAIATILLLALHIIAMLYYYGAP